jgi:hypothetical protein
VKNPQKGGPFPISGSISPNSADISKTQSVIHPDGSHFGEVGKPYNPLSDTTWLFKKWHELSELTLGALEDQHKRTSDNKKGRMPSAYGLRK